MPLRLRQLVLLQFTNYKLSSTFIESVLNLHIFLSWIISPHFSLSVFCHRFCFWRFPTSPHLHHLFLLFSIFYEKKTFSYSFDNKRIIIFLTNRDCSKWMNHIFNLKCNYFEACTYYTDDFIKSIANFNQCYWKYVYYRVEREFFNGVRGVCAEA